MRVLILLLASACGRIDFDARVDASGVGVTDGTDSSSQFCTPGAASGCPAGAIFCDDYEASSGPTFPAWDRVLIGNWNTAGPADPATTLRADGLPCRGARAAHGHDVGSAQAVYTETVIAPLQTPFYVRLWFRIAATSPQNDFELVGLHDSIDSAFVHIGVSRAAKALTINAANFTTALGGMQGMATLLVDTWQCMQMQWAFDATPNGSLDILVDGTSVIHAVNVVTEGSQPMSQLIVGTISGLGETGTYDVDIDEVAVSGLPIACN